MAFRRIALAGLIMLLLGTSVLWWLSFGARSPKESESPAAVHREFQAVALRLKEGFNPWLGTAQVPYLRQVLAERPGPFDEIELRIQLGLELLRLGKTEQAINAYEKAKSLIEQHRLQAPRDFNAIIGLAYWRLAENANCIENHQLDCCVFPLAGGGLHKHTEPAKQAQAYLLAHLKEQPDDLGRQWLLNIAAMALGQYPEGVPEPFRLPPESLRSKHEVPRFVNVAGDLGVDAFNLCGGAIADDFNGDGQIDIITSSYDPSASLIFYANTGDGRFQDRSEPSGLKSQLGGLNCIAADYDNDNDLDLLVLRGAWLHEDGRIRNSLLENDGRGNFRDVTRASGLAENAFPTQAAVWGDFDQDGDLDLFIGNESLPEEGASYPSELYRNNGDGSFTNVASAAGVTNDSYCKGVTAGDFDNDGDLDLYVSNIGANRLFANQGDGTFVDIAGQAGVGEPSGRSFATWFFDYDNDGWLDLFVGAYEATLSDIAADYLKLSHRGVSPKLYRNRGNGTFADVTKQVGLNHPSLPMGANFGDIDNDGWLDIYLTTGDPDYATLTPNLMYRNDRGRAFQDVTFSGGFGHLQKGHGVAFADYDGDGDQDIYHQLGGFFPGDRFRNALLQNPGNGNNFLCINLQGVDSNSFGVGARLRLSFDSDGVARNVHRSVGSVSSFGGSPIRQEIGIANAQRVTEVEVIWPRSGKRQVFRDVPANRAIRITEGNDSVVVLPVKSAAVQATAN